jgi:hypothetical protein
MLKQITFEERMDQAKKEMMPVYLISSVAGLVGVVVMIQDEPDFWTMFLWVIANSVAWLISSVAWILATFWLARIPLRAGLYGFANADKHPKFVQFFMETWWKNEIVLKIFVGTLTTAMGLGIYRLLAPLLGMQGWQTVSGAG